MSLEKQCAVPAKLPGNLLNSFRLLWRLRQKCTPCPKAVVNFTRGGLQEADIKMVKAILFSHLHCWDGSYLPQAILEASWLGLGKVRIKSPSNEEVLFPQKDLGSHCLVSHQLLGAGSHSPVLTIDPEISYSVWTVLVPVLWANQDNWSS